MKMDGLNKASASLFEERAKYSSEGIEKLKDRFQDLTEFKKFPKLTVYVTGSYARLEASKNSDIDMFFVNIGKEDDIGNPNTKKIRLFGKVLELTEELGLQPVSNDGEFLKLLHTDEIVSNLGSPRDDHRNYFTARMLLLLESTCLYGEKTYEELIKVIVNSYYFDYPKHKDNFQTRFLMNDISRYWRTLLLNYENKRRYRLFPITQVRKPISSDPKLEKEENRRKTKQKVKNYKLKYSRMTTCFATIAALGSYTAPVKKSKVIELVKMTPRERLISVLNQIPEAEIEVVSVLNSYATFLKLTGLTTKSLERNLSDENRREKLFNAANAYGDSMFKLLQVIDKANPKLNFLRNVVI